MRSDWTRDALHMVCAVFALAVMSGTVSADVPTKIHQRGEFQFQVSPVPAWVHAHEPALVWDQTAPGASGAKWRNWLIDSQADRRAGKRVRYFDRSYESISTELTREAGKVQIWFNPEFQRLSIHRVAIRRAGKWQDRLEPGAMTLARRESQFEQDMSTGMVSAMLVMNDVQAGDVVRVSYSIDGQNPIMAGLDVEDISFGWTNPILEQKLRVLLDPTAVVSVHADNGAPAYREQRSASALEITASAQRLAAVIDEGNYPRGYPKIPSLVISEKRGWSAVATWVADLYPTHGALPEELETRIATWRALPDDSARIGAALRAVQEEVRYFGIELGDNTHKPAEPALTWTRRYGDCKDKSRLLVAILQAMGIQANAALVSAENGRRVADLPPNAAAFDHVIVQVRVADGLLWLDPTATQQRGAPASIVNVNYGFALPVVAGTKSLIKVEQSKDAINRTRIVEKFTPTEDQALDLLIESEYQGRAADQIRHRFETSGHDALERAYLDFYQRRYGDVVAQAPMRVLDNEVENKLLTTERYRVEKPWKSSGGSERILETWADPITSRVELSGTSRRFAPYARQHPVQVEHLVEFTLPTGWNWQGSTLTRTIEDAAVRFRFDARRVEDVVRIERSFRSLSDQVSVEEFPKHFQILRDINEFLGWRVLASPPEREARKMRDQRMKNLMRGILEENAAGRSRRNGE